MEEDNKKEWAKHATKVGVPSPTEIRQKEEAYRALQRQHADEVGDTQGRGVGGALAGLANQQAYQPPTPPVQTRADYIAGHKKAIEYKLHQLSAINDKLGASISAHRQFVAKLEADAPFSEIYDLQNHLNSIDNRPLE